MLIRLLAILTGCGVLGATAYATIEHTHADAAQQALIWAAAGALVVGAAAVTHTRGAARWALAAALLCGELYGAATSLERVLEARAAKSATGQAMADAIDAAAAKLQAREAALTAARADAAAKAPLPGCKVNCRELLQGAITSATRERDEARAALDALPTPPPADVMATQTGLAPWQLSMTLALLLALATNGLGAVLIGIGTHVPERTPAAMPLDMQPLVPQILAADSAPDTSGPSTLPAGHNSPDRTDSRTEKAAALSDLLNRIGRGDAIPSQDYLARTWNRPKQTVSDWLREWRRLGIIPQETRVGRCKATVA